MPHRKKTNDANTVVGVFATRAEAEAAVSDLRAAGFADGDIGLVGRDASGKVKHQSGDTHADDGAVIGAAAGAGAMALGSLAVTFGVIPVVGPILAVGPLAAALISAGAGAAAGGLAGALIGYGIPEDDAGYYEGEVKAGKFLVTVSAKGRTSEAWDILHRHRGYNRATAAATAGTTTTAGRTMELKEEELEVTKRPVKKGAVEVRKEVITEQRQITVPVEREEVVIERRPARGKAAAGDLKAEEIRIPVSEEEVEVHKTTKVKEEVSVGKRKVTGTKTVGGTVRHEELRVEEEGKVEVRGDAGATRTRK